MKEKITNLNILLDEERTELEELLNSYLYNNSLNNYEESDRIRKELQQWDTLIHVYLSWHPQFEPFNHRRSRAFKRMKRYNTPIYPWSLEDIQDE